MAHDLLTDDEAREDLPRGAAVVREATGAELRFYRPPYGRFSAVSYATCRELGLEPVYWSGWGTDWETISPRRIAEVVAPDLGPGAILLLHDSPRYGHRPTAASTAEALPLIADRAAELGLGFATLARATGRG